MSGYNDDFSRGEGTQQPPRTGADAERFVSTGTGNQSLYQDAGDSGGMGSTYHDTRTGIGGPLGGGSYGGQTSHMSADRAEVEAVRSAPGQSEDRGRQDYGEQSSIMSSGMGREGYSETTSSTTVAVPFGRGDYVEEPSGQVKSVTDISTGGGGPGYYDRLYNGPQGGGKDGGIGGGAGGRDYSVAGVLGGVVSGIAGTSGTTGVTGGTSGMTGYTSGMTGGTSGMTGGTSDMTGGTSGMTGGTSGMTGGASGLTGGTYDTSRTTGLGSESQYTDRSTDISDTSRPSGADAAVERMKHSHMGEVGDTERPGTL